MASKGLRSLLVRWEDACRDLASVTIPGSGELARLHDPTPGSSLSPFGSIAKRERRFAVGERLKHF